jgi:biopolymer transport protein ExbB
MIGAQIHSRLKRLWFPLFAGLVVATLFPAYDALAQAKKDAAAQANEPQRVFQQLQQQIQALRVSEAKLLQQKEAEMQAKLARQQEQTRQMIARRDRAEAVSEELDRQWEVNDKQLEELTGLLKQQQGNLGELFGVTRQTAGDAARVLRESLISTQLKAPRGQEGRTEFMVRITAEKMLPSSKELERLWFELLREMTMSGEVVRYETDVLQIAEDEEEAPGAVQQEVVRVGSFTVIREDEYLGYLSSATKLTELDGQLASRFRKIAADLADTEADAGYTRAVVDPTSGALLGLYLERPNWFQRIAEGEVIGYVIIAVGIIGVLLALAQYSFLLKTRTAVRSQLENLSRPQGDNPLGRLLMAFRGGKTQRAPESPELAELRLSEAVLREVPDLERYQAFLRLAVSAGPLLGLIGTVIGMIITFHAIVSSGTSDPRFMAHGIGQAMIATVLGLGIAIPLLFLNSGLSALSRGIMQILDEQSALLLADTIKNSEPHKRETKKTRKHK